MKQFTTRQIILLSVLLETNITLLHAPSQAGAFAEQHAYCTCLIAAIVLCLPIWTFLKLGQRFPDQDLFQAMVSSHPLIGRILLMIYFVLFLIVFSRDLWIITDLAKVLLLQLTPFFMISLIVLLTIVFMAKGGINTIVNLSEIFIPISILTLLTMPFFFGINMDFLELRPFLHPNMAGIMKGSWYMFSYMADILMIPFVLQGKNYRAPGAWWGHLVGTAFMVMIITLMQLVIGVPILMRLFYPSYELARQLYVTDFLDRFDIFVGGFTIPAILIKLGMDLYVLSMAIKRLFPQVKGDLMVWPVGLLGYICSFIMFSNIIQIYDFSREWTVMVMMFLVVLPLVLCMLLRPKRTGETEKSRMKQDLGDDAVH
ncbi:endospore germination permease [Paenibacillus polymyxa]|uniref:GerAB/ArcD/ProY family transporter n=1 Tax=Paenibacillus polymyxa TaxID=1406 RepID=UPI002AB5740E|nr:endospore germination permease [Paenibacillus polymyxa]MDY8022517.1 endospore germination permease [Paenibacillus polymyxa]